MKRSNPAVIPRNHKVEEALEAAVVGGDFAAVHKLIAALAKPYEDTARDPDLLEPVAPSDMPYRTFCGT
jgi:uncharacterized protein YdiU (UPF0061 family)